MFATAPDRGINGDDLIDRMLDGGSSHIIVGGQQRVCTACHDQKTYERLPLPLRLVSNFRSCQSKFLVKWVLLTPAIFPAIGAGPATGIKAHPGGWLPSWVDLQGDVQLLDGPGKNYAKRHKVPKGQRIPCHLVAAITGKPIPVTGYALPNSADPDRQEGGAKSTHLAVPAGAVYYFEAESPEAAQKLAAALNWHGSETNPNTISNRRSILMGEKGFGLGVCGTWSCLDAAQST